MIADDAQALYEQTTREDIEEWLELIEEALETDQFEPTERDAERIEAVLEHLGRNAEAKPLTPRALMVLKEIRDRAISALNTSP